MKRFFGIEGTHNVLLNGKDWSYGPTGQLALAILLEVTGDKRYASAMCQTYEWDVVSKLESEGDWVLTEDEVKEWIANHKN